ncbi:MAG: class I SAM-dependent methyltransferase, partial [Micrococcales bacterium]|nr:class I SAM-dependent methyltransferase [Micrococcales bacterium]
AATAPHGVALLTEHLGSGAKLIDVGCGTGRIAEQAAEAGFRVTGVEPDPAMLAVAARRLDTTQGPGAPVTAPDPDLVAHTDPPQAALSQIPVALIQAASPGLPFGPEFDAAWANFVLNVVSNPREVLQGIYDVVRNNGLILTVIPDENDSFNRLFTEAAHRAGAVGPTHSPWNGLERTPEGMAALHKDCGGEVVEAGRWDAIVRADLEDLWRGVETGMGAVGNTYLAQTAATQAAMTAAYWDLVAPIREGDELRLPVAVAYALARKREGTTTAAQ